MTLVPVDVLFFKRFNEVFMSASFVVLFFVVLV